MLAYVINNLAPYQLEKIAVSYPDYEINELIKTVFRTFEKQIISYEIFDSQINNDKLHKTLEILLYKKD